MAIPASIAEMERDPEWKFWAAKGWTLHQTPDGKVVAANVAQRLATKRAKHLGALIKGLENGINSYRLFMAFKRFNIP